MLATFSKIISGGQTGVDRSALDAALDNHFPCGGWCPAGRAAEDGPIPEKYPLLELSDGGYQERTIKNIEESNATVIIYFHILEGGTKQTFLHCIRRKKPYQLINATEITTVQATVLIAEFVTLHKIADLNIAGPRLSEAPMAHAYAYACITRLLQLIDNNGVPQKAVDKAIQRHIKS